MRTFWNRTVDSGADGPARPRLWRGDRKRPAAQSAPRSVRETTWFPFSETLPPVSPRGFSSDFLGYTGTHRAVLSHLVPRCPVPIALPISCLQRRLHGPSRPIGLPEPVAKH